MNGGALPPVDPSPDDVATQGHGLDILVVDDVEENLLAVEAVLAALGRRIVTATSGIEALGHLLDGDFALVLLDVQMPGVDGYETASLIRSRQRSRHTPIIFLTAHDANEASVRRAYQLGAVDFMFKPLDADVLRAKVGFFIELQQRTIELAEKARELRLAEHREHERSLEAQRHVLESEAVHRQMELMSAQDRRKDEFLAILGHELRNPLGALHLAVNTLQRKGAEPRKLVDICERQVRHLSRLVDDLLNVSRINVGKFSLQRSLISLAQVARDAIEVTKPSFSERDHTLLTEGLEADPIVNGDAVRLVQVVGNLLSNAAKFTNPGGTIRLTLAIDGANAVLNVTDDGCGLPVEVLDRVFELFVQDRGGSDGKGGLGVGLALVRQIVELHGGSATAFSDGVGCGARFEVRIPLAPASAVALATHGPSSPE